MKSNFKSDIESLIYITIFMFVIGISFFLISSLNQKIYTELEGNLNVTKYADSQAVTTIGDIKVKDTKVWDYAFLGIFLGSLLAIGLSAYSIRISPVFFWIYGILSLIVLALGVILSNTWQDYAAEPDFASIVNNFPITNTILGTYYPLVVTAMIILSLGFLFGKPPEQ